jgi:hypothetical protein
MKRDTCRQNLWTFFAKFLPVSLLGVAAETEQRTLVDESGKIRNEIGTHNRSVNGRSAWMPYMIPHCNSNE